MKLAEALMLRADLQTRIEQLKVRLIHSAKIQEGDTPPEEPSALLADLDSSLERLQSLIYRINAANAESRLEDGRTLTEALAFRDALKLKSGIIQSLIDSASTTGSPRYSKSEVRFLRTVEIGDLRKELDGISKQLRELEVLLQEANWRIDLSEA